MSDPVHRDDLPFEAAEGIVERFKELYPGCKVTFAGDGPGKLREQAATMMAKLEGMYAERLARGVCGDCEKQYPDPWPPEDGDKLADGWGLFTDISTDAPISLQCPQCDADEKDGMPRQIL